MEGSHAVQVREQKFYGYLLLILIAMFRKFNFFVNSE